MSESAHKGPSLFSRRGRPLELLEWAQLFEDDEYRQVAFDAVDGVAIQWFGFRIATLRRAAAVSTIWIGRDYRPGVLLGVVDAPPLIFETLVMGNDKSELEPAVRYETEAQAWAGHHAAVRRARRLGWRWGRA